MESEMIGAYFSFDSFSMKHFKIWFLKGGLKCNSRLGLTP